MNKNFQYGIFPCPFVANISLFLKAFIVLRRVYYKKSSLFYVFITPPFLSRHPFRQYVFLRLIFDSINFYATLQLVINYFRQHLHISPPFCCHNYIVCISTHCIIMNSLFSSALYCLIFW